MWGRKEKYLVLQGSMFGSQTDQLRSILELQWTRTCGTSIEDMVLGRVSLDTLPRGQLIAVYETCFLLL